MNPESQDFESLRRLLALKRHEAPPPRYFNEFSGRVIARVRAGDVGKPESFFERLFGEAPWLRRVFGALEARSAFVSAFGAIACTLLVSGVIYSESVEQREPNPLPQPGVGLSAAAPLAVSLPLGNRSDLISSNVPPASDPSSLFVGQLQLRPEHASFTIPGGN